MLMAHYVHRLPADYDLAVIRERARRRGPLWDDTPDLHYKAFLLREAGRFGAAENAYASAYLWRTGQAFAGFVGDQRIESVTGSFGRPAIETWVPLDARRGPVGEARFASVEERDIGRDVPLRDALSEAVARNRERARQPGTIVSALGLDARTWRLVQVTVSADAPRDGAGVVYQVLHLARPLIGELPDA